MVDLGADVCFAFGELQRMKRGKLCNTGTGDCVWSAAGRRESALFMCPRDLDSPP
jgi:hypothetical protein